MYCYLKTTSVITICSGVVILVIMYTIMNSSNFFQGTDATMLNKMNAVHGKGDIYMSPKNNHDTQFGIRHFAGVVYYDSKGNTSKFLTKYFPISVFGFKRI